MGPKILQGGSQEEDSRRGSLLDHDPFSGRCPLPSLCSLFLSQTLTAPLSTAIPHSGPQSSQISVHNDCPSDDADDEKSHLLLSNQNQNLTVSDGVKSHHYISSTRLFGQICSTFHVWFFMMLFLLNSNFFVSIILWVSEMGFGVARKLQGGPGQPQNLGRNFSMWMLHERVRFTLHGLECNKIGVGYDAFNGQSDPHFRVACIISCGTSERSPDKILSITVPTFEALTQFGTATITTKNIGEVEASYSLTVRNCLERCKIWSRNSRILCFKFFHFLINVITVKNFLLIHLYILSNIQLMIIQINCTMCCISILNIMLSILSYVVCRSILLNIKMCYNIYIFMSKMK